MVHLDYRDVRPIYAQIIDSFKEQITAGILGTGDKLPSVRELAADLAINPNTIQRSYRSLEAEGWIVTVPGKGCFVSANGNCQERERKRLMDVLQETCTALEALGISREELAERIRKGGNDHA
ncbi:MAG: GntR family transcriptional regulator [Oscillospiraceae bacterium]|nr:GntR family transcriptional regulator [Oscillospiraceae bacterium]